ncbi:MAG: tRNA (N(6)-L-threonylcarbamoyladenosine(37)-C(2))-methylthiotransferase MtaB [Leptospiraceae bacterium]|nr:tRNA (N(6)-L-threonylcarbamoyladenosine(37)-C(2))-methylthiotransferase MtaB [Leptospiraceae bacterium]
MDKLTVSFHTLGCRLNLFETDGLATSLEKLGLKIVDITQNPKVIVINTCTVTNKADSKNRNVIRQAIKNNIGSQIWVTGCYAETDKEILEKIPGVTGVIGNTDKSKLPYLILEKLGIQTQIPTTLDRFSYADTVPKGHTRAYLKIQDGCNRVCSYCKIPQARGKGVSRSETDVLRQVEFLQDQGIGEIILTGVNLGWYRDAENKKAFHKLLENILKRLSYSRIRISSIEPSDVNEELGKIMQHPRFCKFLHVPLQSGSSKILRLMKRSYTKETYYKRIEVIKKLLPNVFLGTDVITGFPFETEEEFLETLKTIQDLEISKVHAFPYSPRKGTKAEEFGDLVSKQIKKERVLKAMEMGRKNLKIYVMRQRDRIEEGILEQDGVILTDNYLKVKISEQELQLLKEGQFVNVRLTGELLAGDYASGNLTVYAS